MLKKIAIIALFAFPVCLFAQELKLGHINSSDLIAQLPERAQIEKAIDDEGKKWEAEIQKMTEEYNAKITEFQQKQDSLPESIKRMRISDIQDMEQRIATFRQQAYTELQKKQQDLFGPIIEKVKKAISEVGAEGNFTYIFDTSTQGIVYESTKATDVTDLVKKKLGIK
jgi:outer membrane protein